MITSGLHVSTGAPESLLAGVAGFAHLPEAELRRLVGQMQRRQFAPGQIIVHEGETGDELFVIVEGRVDVTVAGSNGSVPLAHLGPGELFGELALLDSSGKRQATVTAATGASLLTLCASEFRALLNDHPDARALFLTAANAMAVARFLKLASPFNSMNEWRLRELAGRLKPMTFNAGAEILRQGEPGGAAYLLRTGRLEVLMSEPGGQQRRICSLGPGALVGEGALLTDAPRNATVRCTEPCELLAMQRADLLELMASNTTASQEVLQLMQLRQRPGQRPGITVHQRAAPDGEQITILKDPARGIYYRLSAEGFFLWQRLDCRHTLRDLTMDYLTQFKAFSPQAIAGIIAGLDEAGFLQTAGLRGDVIGSTFKLTVFQRLLISAKKCLQWQITIRNIDAPLGKLAAFLRWLYTRPAQAALAVLCTLGLLAFAVITLRFAAATRSDLATVRYFWFLIPALIVSIVIHELGHAITTKIYGRSIGRAGVGWYWFSPVAFVDTSDMWLSERGPRMAVTFAGPYANLLLAAIASIAAYLWRRPVVDVAAWQFAAVSYLLVLINLNPLLEYDGYYLLIDALEAPNLRGRALTWLGQDLPAAIRRPALMRGHFLHLVYGLGMVIYVIGMAVLAVILYRLVVEPWMARIVPAKLAACTGWLLALAVTVISAVGVWQDLRSPSQAAKRLGE